jgi:purine-binding chemotaxis protein CheW
MTGNNRINEILKNLDENKLARKKGGKIVKDFLIAEVGSALIGFHIEYLREVFDLTEMNDIVPVPFTPSFVMGIINVRSEIVPVLSSTGILGISGETGAVTKMIVVDGKFKIGIPVCSIVDLQAVEANALVNVKDPSKNENEHFLTQAFDHGGRQVSVIDVLRLYASHFLS